MNEVKAREKLVKVFNLSGKRVRKTAKILNCSPSTVSKWVKRSELKSLSRKPHRVRRKIEEDVIAKIAIERKRTNFGRRRLVKHLESKYGIRISENTCAYWLRVLKLSRPCKQRGRYKGVRYYRKN
jgi:transposase